MFAAEGRGRGRRCRRTCGETRLRGALRSIKQYRCHTPARRRERSPAEIRADSMREFSPSLQGRCAQGVQGDDERARSLRHPDARLLGSDRGKFSRVQTLLAAQRAARAGLRDPSTSRPVKIPEAVAGLRDGSSSDDADRPATRHGRLLPAWSRDLSHAEERDAPQLRRWHRHARRLVHCHLIHAQPVISGAVQCH